jgi:hypothetical protein
MATNGNNPQVDALEATLRQAQALQLNPTTGPMAATLPAMDGTVTSFMVRLSERCCARLDTLATSADDDRKEAQEFTAHLLDLYRKWAGALIDRKRRELGELEQFLGKVGK